MNSYLDELQEDYTGVSANPVAEEPQAEVVQQQDAVEEVQEVAQEPEVSEKELNFRALREEIAREKQERESERLRHSQEILELRSKVQELHRPDQPKSALDSADDEDILTVGKYRQSVREMQEQHQKQLEQLRLQQEETRARVKYEDYDEVLEKYSIPLLQKNSNFARAFQAAEDKASFAYELGIMARGVQPQAEKPRGTDPAVKAQRIVENANKPGTLSSARGGQPSLSKADYYASMSDAEFSKMVEKNLAEQ